MTAGGHAPAYRLSDSQELLGSWPAHGQARAPPGTVSPGGHDIPTLLCRKDPKTGKSGDIVRVFGDVCDRGVRQIVAFVFK